jgi:hypothetical protein
MNGLEACKTEGTRGNLDAQFHIDTMKDFKSEIRSHIRIRPLSPPSPSPFPYLTLSLSLSLSLFMSHLVLGECFVRTEIESRGTRTRGGTLHGESDPLDPHRQQSHTVSTDTLILIPPTAYSESTADCEDALETYTRYDVMRWDMM